MQHVGVCIFNQTELHFCFNATIFEMFIKTQYKNRPSYTCTYSEQEDINDFDFYHRQVQQHQQQTIVATTTKTIVLSFNIE